MKRWRTKCLATLCRPFDRMEGFGMLPDCAGAQRRSSSVAQTSESAVSQVAKPAGRALSCVLPIWQSAIQQVWQPALPALVSSVTSLWEVGVSDCAPRAQPRERFPVRAGICLWNAR
jgi:hypothetical protein